MGKIVVIAASAGGLGPLRCIASGLPDNCSASVFIAWHIGDRPSALPSVLAPSCKIRAAFGQDGDIIQPAHLYVAPPDHHMLLEPGCVRLSRGPKVHFTRPAADPLFVSAAKAYGDRVVGIVLSGGDGDGAAGLIAIKARGGTSLVQRPDEAEEPSMSHTAIMQDHPDACLSAQGIADLIASICS